MKNNGLDVQVEIDERTKQWNDSGQTNEQIDKWTDGQMDLWTDGWTDRMISALMAEWISVDGKTNRRSIRQTEKWTQGQTDGRTD